MFKLTKFEREKNTYYLEYQVAHTDVYEHDIWFSPEPIIIYSVSNLEQLADYYRCFKFVEDLVMNIGRVGTGEPGNYLPFDRIVEEDEDKEHGVASVEWDMGTGVLFVMKDGTEHFIYAETDIGMPKEDGQFIEGLKFSGFSYIDENGQDFSVEIEKQLKCKTKPLSSGFFES